MWDNDAPNDHRLLQILPVLKHPFHGIWIPDGNNQHKKKEDEFRLFFFLFFVYITIATHQNTFNIGVKYSATPRAVPLTVFKTLCIFNLLRKRMEKIVFKNKQSKKYK